MDDSLIFAFILDGQGSGRRISWDELAQWQPEQGILWVHFNYTKKKVQQWLKKQSGLDKYLATAMVAEESRPRAFAAHDGVFVSLRGVNLNPGQEPEDMVSIRMWLEKDRIITTRHRRLLSIKDVEESIVNNCGPKNTVEFLRFVNDRLLDRISDAVEGIEDNVDRLEQEVLTEESYLLRPQIAESRRETILIRRYLAPQREALYRLQQDHVSWISDEDKIHLRESNDRIIRFIEDLDSSRERATVAQEELTSRLSEQLDRRMYVLSVVAMIFLPLTFLTGLLGINVDGIPGAKSRWGFMFVCGLCIVIFFALILFFKRKKWM